MLAPKLEWLFGNCSCTGCESSGGQDAGQISLNNDATYSSRHMLSPIGREDLGLGVARAMPITPRQRDIRDQLQLPKLQMYPVPPNSDPQDTEEERQIKLLQMYQEVALDLHTGVYLTQLTSNRDYSDIHCQLMEDMTTLKLDQSNGRIIEFPLTNVSKVYRIVKNEDKYYTPGGPAPDRACEHIVVIEFLRRKLAFVFKEVQAGQRFMICMELLIRRAQQKHACRSLTPTFPPRQTQANHGQCPTPRQVYEAMATRPPGPH